MHGWRDAGDLQGMSAGSRGSVLALTVRDVRGKSIGELLGNRPPLSTRPKQNSTPLSSC